MARASRLLRTDFASGRSRQGEIARRLARFGFARGLRVHRTRSAHSQSSYGCELREALESLGPVFSSFGLYLSSRVDVFSAQDCLELGRIPDRLPAMPATLVQEIVTRELSVPAEKVFSSFSDSPLQSRLAYQCHYALLVDGRLVQIRVSRPEFEKHLDEDAEFFLSCDESHPYGAAVADFREVLRQRMDFRNDVRAFEQAARDARVLDKLVAPCVVPEYSNARLLMLDVSQGAARAVPSTDGRDTARSLWLTWLQQALHGRVFAIEPRLGNIFFVPGGVSFAAGDFGSLSNGTQSVLWDYLNAAAAEDPDLAAACLLSEMTESDSCVGEKIYVQKLRQIVPFRDGGWGSGASQSLAEHLFLHWKLAIESGYRPRPHLVQFWRGLFLMASVAHSLSPGEDTLVSTLGELRTVRLLNQMQQLLDVQRFGDRFDRYSMTAMEFPRRLNQLLDVTERGGTRIKLQTRGEHQSSRTGPATTVILLLLAAGALWTRYFSVALPHSEWTERIGALVFLVLAGALLRLVLRSK